MPGTTSPCSAFMAGRRAVFTLGIVFGICVSFLLPIQSGWRSPETLSDAAVTPPEPVIGLMPTLVALTTTSKSVLTATPSPTISQTTAARTVISTPPVKTVAACQDGAAFAFEELVKTPEALFTLARLTTEEWDPVKLAMRVSGVISPIPSLQCRCENGLGGPEVLAACGPHSYFEVSAEGPALLATLPAFDNLTGEWVFDLLIPLAGKYVVTARLHFFSFADLLKDFASKEEALQHHAAHSPRKKFVGRAVNRGNVTLEVAIRPELIRGAEDKRATLCSLNDYRGNLPGYWANRVTLWQPYTCTPQRTPDRKKLLATKWIALLGDSNSRNLFQHLTYKLGVHKDGRWSTRFACIGEDWVITFAQFWPWNLDLQAYFGRGLGGIMDEVGPNITLPEGFRVRRTPDFFFISYGSHTQERTGENYVAEILQTAHRSFPDLHRDQPRFAVLMTTATASEKIPGGDFEKYYLIQNNPRINLVNQEGLGLYDRNTGVLDYFSTTLPLTATNRSRDAVHFQNPLYTPHAVLFFHLLSLQ